MVLCIVAALVLYFMSATRGRLLENGREELERISGEALAYAEGVEQIADYLHRDLYRSQSELEDLLQYFRLEPEEYQQYSLRRYISSEELVYKSVFYFMNQAFEAYSELEKIELVSYETRQLTECRPEKIVFPGKDGQVRLAQIQNQEYCVPGKLVYVKEVREMNTMEPAGCMVFTFEAEEALEKIRSFSPFAEMAVVFGEDQVIFQSPEGADYALRLEDRHYFMRGQSAGEYQIHAFLDERQAARLPWTTFLAILAAGAAAGVIGIFFVDYYAKRFAGRVRRARPKPREPRFLQLSHPLPKRSIDRPRPNLRRSVPRHRRDSKTLQSSSLQTITLTTPLQWKQSPLPLCRSGNSACKADGLCCLLQYC